jgi:hypothetical protein
MKRSLGILIFLAVALGLNAQDQETPKKKMLKQWTLSSDFSEEVLLPFDTVFSLFHRYRLADRYSSLNATLGNYGLPFYQINFFDRITDPDKFLYAYYYPLMHHPDKAVFMNTCMVLRSTTGNLGTDFQDTSFTKREQIPELRTNI